MRPSRVRYGSLAKQPPGVPMLRDSWTRRPGRRAACAHCKPAFAAGERPCAERGHRRRGGFARGGGGAHDAAGAEELRAARFQQQPHRLRVPAGGGEVQHGVAVLPAASRRTRRVLQGLVDHYIESNGLIMDRAAWLRDSGYPAECAGQGHAPCSSARAGRPAAPPPGLEGLASPCARD